MACLSTSPTETGWTNDVVCFFRVRSCRNTQSGNNDVLLFCRSFGGLERGGYRHMPRLSFWLLGGTLFSAAAYGANYVVNGPTATNYEEHRRVVESAKMQASALYRQCETLSRARPRDYNIARLALFAQLEGVRRDAQLLSVTAINLDFIDREVKMIASQQCAPLLGRDADLEPWQRNRSWWCFHIYHFLWNFVFPFVEAATEKWGRGSYIGNGTTRRRSSRRVKFYSSEDGSNVSAQIIDETITTTSTSSKSTSRKAINSCSTGDPRRAVLEGEVTADVGFAFLKYLVANALLALIEAPTEVHCEVKTVLTATASGVERRRKGGRGRGDDDNDDDDKDGDDDSALGANSNVKHVVLQGADVTASSHDGNAPLSERDVCEREEADWKVVCRSRLTMPRETRGDHSPSDDQNSEVRVDDAIDTSTPQLPSVVIVPVAFCSHWVEELTLWATYPRWCAQLVRRHKESNFLPDALLEAAGRTTKHCNAERSLVVSRHPIIFRRPASDLSLSERSAGTIVEIMAGDDSSAVTAAGDDAQLTTTAGGDSVATTTDAADLVLQQAGARGTARLKQNGMKDDRTQKNRANVVVEDRGVRKSAEQQDPTTCWRGRGLMFYPFAPPSNLLNKLATDAAFVDERQLGSPPASKSNGDLGSPPASKSNGDLHPSEVRFAPLFFTGAEKLVRSPIDALAQQRLEADAVQSRRDAGDKVSLSNTLEGGSFDIPVVYVDQQRKERSDLLEKGRLAREAASAAKAKAEKDAVHGMRLDYYEELKASSSSLADKMTTATGERTNNAAAQMASTPVADAAAQERDTAAREARHHAADFDVVSKDDDVFGGASKGGRLGRRVVRLHITGTGVEIDERDGSSSHEAGKRVPRLDGSCLAEDVWPSINQALVRLQQLRIGEPAPATLPGGGASPVSLSAPYPGLFTAADGRTVPDM